MEQKWKKGLSAFLAVLLTTGCLSVPVRAAEGNGQTQITDGEMEALLESLGAAGEVTSRKRVSVHDPSVAVDGNSYYVFGSHMGTAKTTDLSDWTSVFGESESSTLFGDVNGQAVSYKDAFQVNAFQDKVMVTAPSGQTSEVDFGTYNGAEWILDNTVAGNMWAPDVIYNAAMQKWCMYLSLNGAVWNSSVILLTAEDIEGPYVYQGPVVFTGFSLADSSQSFHDTDLELVLGTMEELPEKYRQISDKSQGDWGTWWPHAIDPSVFYDEEGKLWMSYGSWSGGICMLELDENTGLRDYTVTYESDCDTLGKSYTSDAYFGKRVAGGYYVSGEGPYIERIGDYYYLFMSYGFYSPEGGYNMRIFRSENPDGPYVDSQGRSAVFNKYVHNYSGADLRGERLMAGYKWDTMDKAEVAQGHNSAFVDSDGKAYVIYHTKFADGTASHEVRVHQLFVNADGWLVAAPYEYGGETLEKKGYSMQEAAGEYDIIVHDYVQDYANLKYATPKQITLKENGTVSGAFSGTWSLDSGKPEITLVMDGHTYKGVLVSQKVDGAAYSALCFTAVNEEGQCIWGTSGQDAKTVIASNVKSFGFGVPERAYESFSLPEAGFGGASITWTSSNPQLLGNDGSMGPNVSEDTLVTMTAAVSKDGYYYNMEFPVMVMAGDGSYQDRTLIASYFENNPQDLSGKLDGSLNVPNPFYQGTSKGLDLSGGVSIEFDVVRTGEVHPLATVLGFTGGGKLYFTPGSYLGYNAAGGYFDANIDIRQDGYYLAQDYIGSQARITLTFLPQGFEVKKDGETVFTQELVNSDYGQGTLTDYSLLLKWLYESADTLNFGSGSWWSETGRDEAECTVSNVKCYVEPVVGKEAETVWYEKDEFILDTNNAITYEDNPFYGVKTDALYMEYTINFAQASAKNGWDGIMSFYNTASAGRVSIQSNPYICFNDGTGKWIDINKGDIAGATNWAASAKTGQDYRVTLLVTKDGARATVDGQEITLGISSSGASYSELLGFLSDCDKLTLGVGLAETAYWNTELCTVKDVVIASTSNVSGITKELVELTSDDFLEVNDNPFQGKTLKNLVMEYTVNFSQAAAQNGWDGLFSFFNTQTGGRVSMQSNPYLCFNNGAGIWMDINNPDGAGGTKWAASAVKGQDYRVKVTIDQKEVKIWVDGQQITTSLAADGGEAAEILNFISSCDQLTFGVGKAVTSYWWTELAALKDIKMKAVY